ncbi:MAG: LamG-like jellyroll fold domain-containing protein [Candidatus Altiarchaeota archaeon]
MSGKKGDWWQLRRHGFIISSDSVWALTFTIIFMLGFMGMQFLGDTNRGRSTFEELHSVSENGIDTLDKRGVLEEIGYFWAIGNTTYAETLAKKNLDLLVPRTMGYRIEIIDQDNITILYSSDNYTQTGRIPEMEASETTRSMRLISGYSQNQSRAGWSARAWLVENKSWGADTLMNSSVCCDGLQAQMVQEPMGGKPLYLVVPADASLVLGLINISWEGVEPSSETTSSSDSSTEDSSSSSTSSSSSESSLGGCHVCPADPACPTGASYHTEMDEYNYHSFVVPAGKTCNLDVKIYTGDDGPLGTNIYDIFINKQDQCTPQCDIVSKTCGCQCQRPPERPDLWPWDYTTFYDGYGKYRTVTMFNLGNPTSAEKYQVMIDCWSPTGADYLCPGDYYIYVKALPGSSAGCPNDPDPIIISTSSSSSSSSSGSSMQDCGNGAVDPGEECDDGNSLSDDGCSSACEFELCRSSGMIGYWRMDESGSKAHNYAGGSDCNFNDDASWSTGKIGRAVNLDGWGDYLSCGNAGGLNKNMGQTTVAGWMYADATPSSGEGMFSKSTRRYGCTYSTDGQVWCYIGGAANNINYPVGVGGWHYIVETFDGINMTLYVDGVKRATRVSTSSSTGTGGNFNIGDLSGYFNGRLDEVAIWERALTQGEIDQLYGGGSGGSACYLTGPDGITCTDDSECSSGHCAIDYDGSGSWCAPAAMCAHNATAPGSCGPGCMVNPGAIASVCAGAASLWNCTNGAWAATNCSTCGSGLGRDAPCMGVKGCVAGSPATCLSVCDTDGLACDFCGSLVRGAPGSDTLYDASCSGGICQCTGGNCSMPPSRIDCGECMSCNVTGYSGSCKTVGTNTYLDKINDTVSPNMCGAGEYCDGAGSCVAAPIGSCSPAPTGIKFAPGVCAQSVNCDEDESGSPGIRLNSRDHFAGQTYLGGWGTCYAPPNDVTTCRWRYLHSDEDDMSIGTPDYGGYLYVKHGDHLYFNASVDGGDSIDFDIQAMPESDCSMTLTLQNNGGQLIGSCTVGTMPGAGSDCRPNLGMNLYNSQWYGCSIQGDAAIASGAITKNAVNTFKLTTASNIGGSFVCGIDKACVTFVDNIDIACS